MTKILLASLAIFSFFIEAQSQNDTLHASEISINMIGDKFFATKVNDTLPFTGFMLEYHNGTLKIDWIQRIESGQTMELEEYHENGAKKSFKECGYSGSQGNGKYIEWYEDGAKKIEGAYSQGYKDGSWTYYYNNGSKRFKGKYAKDKKVGKWQEWEKR